MNNADSPSELLKEAKRALSMGENFLAYDLAEKSPDANGNPSPEKIHIMSLSLARSGSLSRAKEIAALLPETEDESAIYICGLKSRLIKDTAIATRDPHERKRLFLEAAQISERIFNQRHSWYNGINAASCYLLSGDAGRARQIAISSVLPLCLSESHKDMWLDATFGECYLLLGDYTRSAEFYSRAAHTALETDQFGNFASTLRQLRLLTNEIGEESNSIWASLRLPRIAVFSGHCIDECSRKEPRFPLSAVPKLRQRIASAISELSIKIGFCSCAAGSDLLFAEELLSSGGECHIVPPFSIDATIKNCIAKFQGDWEIILRTVMAHPKCRIIEPECDETGENEDCAYDFTNRYLLGLSLLKARDLNLPLVGLAVWDHEEAGLPGGTSSAVNLWKDNSITISTINPKNAI